MTKRRFIELAIGALAAMIGQIVVAAPPPAPKTHTVTIPTKQVAGEGCTIDKSWGPKMKIRVTLSQKETVTWDFRNECSDGVTLAVANFRPVKDPQVSERRAFLQVRRPRERDSSHRPGNRGPSLNRFPG
jgi:hypothetical protein